MIFHFPPHVILSLAGISFAFICQADDWTTCQIFESEMEDLSLKSLKSQQLKPQNQVPQGASRPFVTSLEQFQTEKISAVSVGIPMGNRPCYVQKFPNQAWGRTFSHAWRVSVRFQDSKLEIHRIHPCTKRASLVTPPKVTSFTRDLPLL